jgi:hypothetical protein
MSADFNIKPVGAPVAAPFVSPVSQTAQKAIPTELPTSQSVAAPEPAVSVGMNSNAANASSSNQGATVKDQVFVDPGAGEVVYQVVDNRTNLVTRQYPEEAALRRRAYYRTLDLGRDSSTRAQATDRQA